MKDEARAPTSPKGLAKQAALANFGITRIDGHTPIPKPGYGSMYDLSAKHPDFESRLPQLLDQTMVNGKVTLLCYIQLRLDDNSEKLAEIRARKTQEPQYGIMTLGRQSAPVYQFYLDGDTYSGSYVDDLWRWLHTEGHETKTSPPKKPLELDGPPAEGPMPS